MPKDRKNLDFHELMRQPGFEWIRLYFEKNYPNKNFLLDPICDRNFNTKKEGVYYLAREEAIYSASYLNGKRPLHRRGYFLADRILYRSWDLPVIKITVI